METNNRDGGRSITYAYDQLKRLTSAQSAATSGADCWGQSIPTDGTGYDRYGNLLTINATKCPSNTPTLSVSVNAFNRLGAGFAYDAPGNMTHDGLYTYTWDDQNHLTSGNGWNYFYDGDGKLVKKTTGTLFWKALDGTTLEETDLSGNTVESYIFLAGRRVAQRDAASGNVFYYVPDALGATRTLTTANGTLCFDADYYPFGGEIDFTSNCTGQAYQQNRYAGMELHPDIGSKYLTMFRIYTTNQGRWLSPDPLGGDISNPQSLNRYTYVLNNPCSLTDPLGFNECNFNITINNAAGIAPSQLNAAEAQINAVLGAVPTTSGDKVGALFSFTGKADYTLNIVSGNPKGDLGWQKNFLFIHFPATVSAAAISRGFSTQPGVIGQVIGTIGAHELTHRITGVGELPLGQGLMSLDALIAQDLAQGTYIAYNLLASPGVPADLQLTPELAAKLYSKCTKKHPGGNVPGPGGSGKGNSDVPGYDPRPIWSDKTCSWDRTDPRTGECSHEE